MKNKIRNKVTVLVVAIAMMFAMVGVQAVAADFNGLAAGTYKVDVDLTCYVTAMGGIEFGQPLVHGSTVTVG